MAKYIPKGLNDELIYIICSKQNSNVIFSGKLQI